jgi:hypothetical protein
VIEEDLFGFDLSNTIAVVQCRLETLFWLTGGELPSEPLLHKWVSDRHRLTIQEYEDLAHLLKIYCRQAHAERKKDQSCQTEVTMGYLYKLSCPLPSTIHNQARLSQGSKGDRKNAGPPINRNRDPRLATHPLRRRNLSQTPTAVFCLLRLGLGV